LIRHPYRAVRGKRVEAGGFPAAAVCEFRVLHLEHATPVPVVLATVYRTFGWALRHRETKAVSQFGRGRHPLIRLEAWIGQEGYV
jgi:hypothetical protein